MTTNNDEIRSQVESQLPSLESKSNEDLYAEIGQIALSDKHFAIAPSQSQKVEAGEEYVQKDYRIHDVICNAKNEKLIDDVITTANVTAIITLLAPVLGFPAIAVPAVVITVVVLILKIGLDEYCGDSTSQPDKGQPS